MSPARATTAPTIVRSSVHPLPGPGVELEPWFDLADAPTVRQDATDDRCEEADDAERESETNHPVSVDRGACRKYGLAAATANLVGGVPCSGS